MKELYIEHFLVKDFLDKYKTPEHIDIWKKTLDMYQNENKRYINPIVVEKLEFLIDGKQPDCTGKEITGDVKVGWMLNEFADDFFDYIYKSTYEMDESYNKILNLNIDQKYIDFFKEKGKYFAKICKEESNKRYWQKKSIEQEYVNEDIIITDTCYIKPRIDFDLKADTIYGDWSCTCFNKDTKQPIGHFCADAGNVGITKLKDILKTNPDFEKWMKEHDWCVTLIKNFTGTAYIKYDIEEFEYKGKPCKELYCYVEGIGNINFTTRQTGL